MRRHVLITSLIAFGPAVALSGCYSHTVEEKQPVIVQAPAQQPGTVFVAPSAPPSPPVEVIPAPPQ